MGDALCPPSLEQFWVLGFKLNIALPGCPLCYLRQANAPRATRIPANRNTWSEY